MARRNTHTQNTEMNMRNHFKKVLDQMSSRRASDEESGNDTAPAVPAVEPVALVWHYTIGDRLQQIVESGEIRQATAGVNMKLDEAALWEIILTGVAKPISQVVGGEMPAVWFTTRETFEPTAMKGMMMGGFRRTMSLDEMEQHGNGLARIGVRAELVPADWQHHVRHSGITSKMARALAGSASAVGSDPRQWRVHYAPVSSSVWSAVQVWRAGQWVNYWDLTQTSGVRAGVP
jgi:hypothetical protein